jgi:hypothetical protein
MSNYPQGPSMFLKSFLKSSFLLGTSDHTCNPSFLGGLDWEHHGFRSAQRNSL